MNILCMSIHGLLMVLFIFIFLKSVFSAIDSIDFLHLSNDKANSGHQSHVYSC